MIAVFRMVWVSMFHCWFPLRCKGHYTDACLWQMQKAMANAKSGLKKHKDEEFNSQTLSEVAIELSKSSVADSNSEENRSMENVNNMGFCVREYKANPLVPVKTDLP